MRNGSIGEPSVQRTGYRATANEIDDHFGMLQCTKKDNAKDAGRKAQGDC